MTKLQTAPIVLASFGTGDSAAAMQGTSADYSESTRVGATIEEVTETLGAPDATQWALDWLASDAAKKYEGRWVALSPDLRIHADGDSPSALKPALADRSDLVILYVIPENARLVGGGWLIATPH